jgi:hypothetical protein
MLDQPGPGGLADCMAGALAAGQQPRHVLTSLLVEM